MNTVATVVTDTDNDLTSGRELLGDLCHLIAPGDLLVYELVDSPQCSIRIVFGVERVQNMGKINDRVHHFSSVFRVQDVSYHEVDFYQGVHRFDYFCNEAKLA